MDPDCPKLLSHACVWLASVIPALRLKDKSASLTSPERDLRLFPMQSSCFIIQGVRATSPACGRSFVRYGGNTTCISLCSPQGTLYFDTGSGFSARPLPPQRRRLPMTILFTHFHLDHLLGLPAFDPLYSRSSKITLLGNARYFPRWKNILREFMRKPYWPLGLGDVSASLRFNNLPGYKSSARIFSAHISWFPVPHPQGCLSYRAEIPGCSVVIATDLEYTPENIDPKFIKFCQNTDYLLFDAEYTPSEYKKHAGWGHSTWKTATTMARSCGAKHLILVHHARRRSDRDMDKILRLAKRDFVNTRAAHEGMILPF
jgi:phosphoribosyl 1,2-cyclic phosphodiesterase